MSLFKESRKYLFLCLITSLLLTFTVIPFVNPTQVSAASKKYQITCYTTLVYNHHVGNEWNCRAKIKGKTLRDGSSCTVSSGSPITIVSKVTENDKRPDTASSAKHIKISNLSSGQTKKFSTKVTVRENSGRYSGNTAKWKFSYVIKRI